MYDCSAGKILTYLDPRSAICFGTRDAMFSDSGRRFSESLFLTRPPPLFSVYIYICMCTCTYVCIYMLPHAPTFSYLYREIPTRNRLSWAGGEATNTFQLPGPDFSNFQLSNFLDLTFQLPNFPAFQLSSFPTFQVSNFPTFQHSNVPTFQRSNFPTSQLPNIPTFQHSNIPIFQLSNLFGPNFGMLDSWRVRPKQVGKLESWKV